jgi:hypothetical protein
MTDLQQQVETYLRTTSIPVDVGDLVSDLEFKSLTDASRERVSRRRRPVFAFAFAAVFAVFLIGVPLLVFGGFSSTPLLRDSATTPTTPESVTSATDVVPTTTPTPTEPDASTYTEPVSGEWIVFTTAAELPGTPIDTVAVDASDGVWVLAHTDDPTTAQLYGFDADTRVFVARGAPLQLTAEWYTLWMEATSTGVVLALDESDESAGLMQRLWQWDDAGWHDLSEKHNLPNLDMSIAQRSPGGGLTVAGYTAELGPVAIDIASTGVSYSVAPEGVRNGGTPSGFTVRHAVLPIGPDNRSWFSNGEDSVTVLGADGYDQYNADDVSGCCYVPLAADESGVWAYFGSDLYRYDSDGWRAEASIPSAFQGAEVVAVTVTADGDIWVLGRNGAALFDPNISNGTPWTVYSDDEAQATGLPAISFQSTVIREDDTTWIAGWGSSGLSIWRHSGHEWAHVDLPASIDQEGTGFRQNTVVAHGSGIWVATSTGIARFDTTP